FAAALGPVLRGQAAFPARGVRPVRLATRAPDAKQVAVAGRGDLAGLLVAILEIHEHLHLNSATVAGADRGDRIAPDKEAGVADLLGVHMHPIEFRDKVLVLLRGAEIASRMARGDDLAVLHKERAGMAIDVDPAGQVAAVE